MAFLTRMNRKLFHNKTALVLGFIFILWLTVFAANRRRGYRDLEEDADQYPDSFNYDGQDGKNQNIVPGDDTAGYNYDDNADDAGEDMVVNKVKKGEVVQPEDDGAAGEDIGEEAEPRDESNVVEPKQEEPDDSPDKITGDEEVKDDEELLEEEEGDSDMDDMEGAGEEEGDVARMPSTHNIPGLAPPGLLMQYNGQYEVPTPEMLINISGNPDFDRRLDTLSSVSTPYTLVNPHHLRFPPDASIVISK